MNNATQQPLRLAFAGFRHGHVLSLYRSAAKHANVQIVAACEEDPASATATRAGGIVTLTHTSFTQMLAEVPCDAVAVGDFYGIRGALALAALRAGKHVIADKPLCTSLAELDQIAALVADGKLRVGCLLDLRINPVLLSMRRLIRAGAIGTVHTVLVTAQHPLLPDTRPGWYFEPGKHGGTLNDIGIHAVDIIPWLSGREIVEISAARAWNARLPQFPQFQDGAQFMLRLDNQGGVIGDLSYLAPEAAGYSAAQYWRICCHGEAGVLEGSVGGKTLMLASAKESAPQAIALESEGAIDPLDAFLQELAGKPAQEGALTTAGVLRASRQALLLQEAADRHRTGVAV